VYRFSDSLPYLLTRVGVRMGELFARELRDHGMTLPGYRVLAALTERSDQRLGDLAAMTSVEISTLSRLVGGLQRRDLLTRTRPEGDQRSVRIRLSPAGTALARRLMPRAAHFERVAVGELDAAAEAALKSRLKVIYANLDALETPALEMPAKDRDAA
jgi:MarR family transcriptional regulator, organic hydroperoxide resistance regulator